MTLLRDIVVAPGRDNSFEALGWLSGELESAGHRVRGVTYSRDDDSILQDPADVAEAVRDAMAGSAGAAPVLVGFSRGASAVLNARAAGTPALAVVAISGASDQVQLMNGYRVSAPESRTPQALRARGAFPEQDPETYRQASTLVHAARFGVPVLLVHGTADMVIPIEHSRRLRDAIAAAGGSVSLVEIPGAGHFFERGFGEPATTEVSATVVGWLAAHT